MHNSFLIPAGAIRIKKRGLSLAILGMLLCLTSSFGEFLTNILPNIPGVSAANPVGSLDVANCVSISGWTTDADAGGAAIDASIYESVNGTNWNPVAGLPSNEYRPDVGYHDFTLNINENSFPQLFDGQVHQIRAYGLNVGAGANAILTNSPRSIQCCGRAAAMNLRAANQLQFAARPDHDGFVVHNYSNCNIPVTGALFTVLDNPGNQSLYQMGQWNIPKNTTNFNIPLGYPPLACRWTQIDLAYGYHAGLPAGTSLGVFNNHVNWWSNGLSGEIYQPGPVCISAAPILAHAKYLMSSSYINRGDIVEYRLDVYNGGNANADNTYMVDPIPFLANGTATFLPSLSDPRCSVQGANVVCVKGTLTPGEWTPFTVRFRAGSITDSCAPTSTTLLKNTSYAAANGLGAVFTPPVPDVTVECPPPPTAILGITKTAMTTSISQGGAVGYSITVTNTGTGPANNVVITDTLPTLANRTISFNSANPALCSTFSPGVVKCNIGTLAANDSRTIQLYVNMGTAIQTCTEGDTTANSATVTASNITPPIPTAATSATVHVTCTVALALTKMYTPYGSGPVYRGSNIRYTLTARNSGNATVSDIVVTDPMPAISGVSVTTGILPTGCTQATPTADIVCVVPGSLAPGATKEFVLLFKVGNFDDSCTPGTVVTLQNSATVSATSPYVTPVTATANPVNVVCPTREPNLSITKQRLSMNPILRGGTSTFRLTIASTGNIPAQTVIINDVPVLDGGTAIFVGGAPNYCEFLYGGLEMRCDFGTMNPGQQKIIDVDVLAGSFSDPCIPNSTVVLTNTMTATATGNGNGNNSVNKTTYALQTVQCAPLPNNAFFIDDLAYGPLVCLPETEITLASAPNPSLLHELVTLTATVLSQTLVTDGVVYFKEGAVVLGTGSVVNGIATFQTGSSILGNLALGAHNMLAYYAGSLAFAPSTSLIHVHTVQDAPVTSATTTVLESNNNPSAYNESITFTANVTSQVAGTITGTVTFRNGSSIIGDGPVIGGSATFQTSTLVVDTHDISATYEGDALYDESSDNLSQVVDKAATTTGIASDNNPAEFQEPITFTATVTPSDATGTVNFKEGNTILGTGTLSGGSATFDTNGLAVGLHTITAEYEGDASYEGSSENLVQDIDPATGNPTTTVLSSNNNPSAFGDPVTFTATVTSPTPGVTGTVHFIDNGVEIATDTLSGGTATYTTSNLSPGSHPITAVYEGNATYAASTSNEITQNVLVSPTGADFFVFRIDDPNQIEYLSSEETGQGIEDISIGSPGRVTAASPIPSHALMVLDVTNELDPALELFMSAVRPGTAAAIVPEISGGPNGLTLLGTSQSGAIVFPHLANDNPNSLVRYQLSDNFTVSRLRLDPTGCYAFMATDATSNQLKLGRVKDPVTASIVQNFDAIGLGRGTSVLHHPWGTGNGDRLFFTSENALSILGPVQPGDGTCQ